MLTEREQMLLLFMGAVILALGVVLAYMVGTTIECRELMQ